MSKAYSLEIENVGEDTYILMSRGHHDPHEFMRQARADGYGWPLGMPKHYWTKRIPAARGSGYYCHYVMVPEGTKGAFPTTYAHEAYGGDQYEALCAAQHPRTDGGGRG